MAMAIGMIETRGLVALVEATCGHQTVDDRLPELVERVRVARRDLAA